MRPTHPDAVFGPDKTPFSRATYSTIATQIREMAPRALTTDQLDDVITIIEFMRDECLRIHDTNEEITKKLDQREFELTALEKELALRSRALNAAALLPAAKPRRGALAFWK